MVQKIMEIKNSKAFDFNKIEIFEISEFRKSIIKLVKNGCHISSFFAVPEKHFSNLSTDFRLLAVLTKTKKIYVLSTLVGKSYESLTKDCVQAEMFEREIYEQYEIIPIGHPNLKPVRYEGTFDKNKEDYQQKEIGSAEFYKIDGEEIHEVAVGPVHAGVIEPGHFRFQCHGENVFNLEISLGYQHRGIEKALLNGPDIKTKYLIETLAGDTTIGHSTSYAQIIEALSDFKVNEKVEAIRAIALELERIANHVGDLGALSGDVGYLPTKSFCGRIRGNFLNLTAEICGNRFGRGLIIPYSTGYDIDKTAIENLVKKLKSLYKELEGAVSLLWKSNSVLSRFERTGILTEKMCENLGIVGLVARASNVEMDVRTDFPFGIYKKEKMKIATNKGGDVHSRAFLRWLEIKNSYDFILKIADLITDELIENASGSIKPEKIAVSFVEGWRGEICHVAITDSKGKFIRYKIVDPSFHNWKGLSMVLRGEGISDFPLCNKSFNLSYCGHDL